MSGFSTAVKRSRVWPVFFAGVALSLLPERVKNQHRIGEIVVWLSAFPKPRD